MTFLDVGAVLGGPFCGADGRAGRPAMGTATTRSSRRGASWRLGEHGAHDRVVDRGIAGCAECKPAGMGDEARERRLDHPGDLGTWMIDTVRMPASSMPRWSSPTDCWHTGQAGTAIGPDRRVGATQPGRLRHRTGRRRPRCRVLHPHTPSGPRCGGSRVRVLCARRATATLLDSAICGGAVQGRRVARSCAYADRTRGTRQASDRG